MSESSREHRIIELLGKVLEGQAEDRKLQQEDLHLQRDTIKLQIDILRLLKSLQPSTVLATSISFKETQ